MSNINNDIINYGFERDYINLPTAIAKLASHSCQILIINLRDFL